MRDCRVNILKGLLFLFVFAIIHILINHFYIPWSRSDTEYEITRRQFDQFYAQTCILVLGDSHSKFSVNPEFFNGMFSLTTNGENYIQTYYKFKYYLDRRDLNIQLAILPVDLHSFSSYRTNRIPDLAFWKRYIDFIELGIYKGDLYSYLGKWVQGEMAYLGRLDETIQKEIIGVESEFKIINKGFIQAESEIDDNHDEMITITAQDSVSRHFRGDLFMDKDIEHYFIKLIDLLEAYHISIVFVWYPVTQEYYLEASKFIPVDDFLSEVERMLLQRNGIILDYHDLYWGQNDLFWNAGHLNISGANLFSQRLRVDLQELFPDLKCDINP